MLTHYDILYYAKREMQFCLSASNIVALRDFYFGYTSALATNGIPLAEGTPPFRLFTDWLARRFGKSGRSNSGAWYKCHAGWWTLLEKEAGDPAAAFTLLFQCLDEFRSARATTLLASELDDPGTNTSSLLKLEAIQYLPDAGVYLVSNNANGERIDDAYFGNIEDLVAFVEEKYRIDRRSWKAASKQSGSKGEE